MTCKDKLRDFILVLASLMKAFQFPPTAATNGIRCVWYFQIVTFDFQARFSYIAVSLIFWRLFAIVFYLLSALSLPYLYLPYRLCACRQSFGLIQIEMGWTQAV